MEDAGQKQKDRRMPAYRAAPLGDNHDSGSRYFTLNKKDMKKIEIITDEHRHHVYVGNTDFWLDTMELIELYKKLGHVKL